MKKIIAILIFSSIIACKQTSKTNNKNFTTLFEKSNGTETPEYNDVISFYKDLAQTYNEISLFEIGNTDSGKPLHLAVFNSNGSIDLKDLKHSLKNRVLINNGIHPGESDGIDASMLLLRDIVQNDSLKNTYKKFFDLRNPCLQYWWGFK
ncbi:M14 family zinc carboxypeptidase [Tenacibaculum ovolyticum]|uniref:M14 family zinc carboxypeptidase n=1 Tax=Tenacibaculum ovolyticum TaxID=104270 RepID=UPI002FDE10E8